MKKTIKIKKKTNQQERHKANIQKSTRVAGKYEVINFRKWQRLKKLNGLGTRWANLYYTSATQFECVKVYKCVRIRKLFAVHKRNELDVDWIR